MKNFISIIKNHKYLITIGSILIWFLYSLVYVISKNYIDAKTFCGYWILIGQSGFDLIAMFITFRMYKNNKNNKDSVIYLLFSTSFFFAFLADSTYNFFLNIRGMNSYGILIDSIFDIPFILFLLLQSIAWIIVSVKNKTTLSISYYLPSIFISSIMLSIFIFIIPWKINHFSILGLYQSIDTILEAIGFAAAIVCLSRSKNIAIFNISIGYMLIISSDLMIRSGVIQNDVKLLSPLETTWTLGLILMCSGFFLFQKEKQTLRNGCLN